MNVFIKSVENKNVPRTLLPVTNFSFIFLDGQLGATKSGLAGVEKDPNCDKNGNHMNPVLGGESGKILNSIVIPVTVSLFVRYYDLNPDKTYSIVHQ